MMNIRYTDYTHYTRTEIRRYSKYDIMNNQNTHYTRNTRIRFEINRLFFWKILIDIK